MPRRKTVTAGAIRTGARSRRKTSTACSTPSTSWRAAAPTRRPRNCFHGCEEILNNLQPSLAEQGLEQQMPPLADMLQDLGELLQRQQELMDQTYRLPRNGEEGR